MKPSNETIESESGADALSWELLSLFQTGSRRQTIPGKDATNMYSIVKTIRGTLLIVAFCFVAEPVTAAIINVPADQPTIQQAITAASDGDTVKVFQGTYFENIDFEGKAISVRSVSGPAQTIIDGINAGTVVTFQTSEGRKSKLTGFTIQHGNASFGAGVYVLGASPTIIQNIFRDNAQGAGGFGAAIGGNSSSPVIQNNTFLNNICDTQFLSGVVSFVNDSSPLIINNIFEDNPCRAINMSLPEGPTPVVANNTIVRNSVGVYVDAGVPASAQLYANNIIVGNGVGYDVPFNAGDVPVWQNNLVFNNTINYSGIADQTGLNGNISLSPKFVGMGNFELRAGSPAIDAGTLSVPHLPAIDLAGNPRVLDGNGDGTALPDMGAFEFVP